MSERFQGLVAFLVSFLVTFLLCVIMGFVGHHGGIGQMRTDAIEHGVAEWRLDPQTGEKEFHWLPAATKHPY